MEFLPSLYELAKIYAFFCLVTSITAVWINFSVLFRVRPFGIAGTISYLLTTAISAFIFAPAFFIVVIFFSEVYKVGIIKAITDKTDNHE